MGPKGKILKVAAVYLSVAIVYASFRLFSIIQMELLQILLVLCSSMYLRVDSLMFHLEANARKCLAEEIRQNILVTGEYEVSEMPGQQVNDKYSVNIFTKTPFHR